MAPQENPRALCSATTTWSSTELHLLPISWVNCQLARRWIPPSKDMSHICHFLILLGFNLTLRVIFWRPGNASLLSLMRFKVPWLKHFCGPVQHCSWLFLESGKSLKISSKALLQLSQQFSSQFQVGQKDMGTPKLWHNKRINQQVGLMNQLIS